MTSIAEEVETKYDVDRHANLPVLELLPCVDHVERTDVKLRATYFDTDDLALLGAGITLRRRTGGIDAGWHLKLPDRGRRHEVQLPLDAAGEAPPPSLTEIVRVVTRGQPLHPVATIETWRSVARLIGTDNRPIGDVADDRVTARQSAPSGAESTWREWEFELARRPDAAVTDVAAALARAGAAPAARTNKLAFALGVVDAAPGRETRAGTAVPASARDVVDAYLAHQVAELRMVDPLARADVPDAVHRLRVAGRRIRAVLATYGSMFDRDQAQRTRRDLKWAIDELGAPRDLEVLRERVRELDADLPASTDGDLAVRHDRAHRSAVTALSSSRYLDLLDSLGGLRTRPSALDAVGDPGVALRKPLRREVRRLAARAAAADRAKTVDERDRRLHDARRSAKRLRYAVEAAQPTFGDDATSYADRLAHVQDVLGTHHDLVVLRSELLAAAKAADRSTIAPALAELNLAAVTEEEAARRALHEVLRKRSVRWLRR